MTTNKGQVFIVSGPSGCGKSTLLRRVFAERDKMYFSISATTRGPREGERDGVEYYFVDKNKFRSMIENDELLEYAEYSENSYGTPAFPVSEKINEGYDVVMDIEVQGAAQVKKKIPESVSIFITPPSLEELERRLRSRGTETEEKIQKRLATARKEIPLSSTYDYVIINDTVDRASSELLDIIEKVTNRK
jgi:guanylate kinase